MAQHRSHPRCGVQSIHQEALALEDNADDRVKVALVTLNDSADVHHWSGLNYYIARSLEHHRSRVAEGDR
jgi:hypothetical protein